MLKFMRRPSPRWWHIWNPNTGIIGGLCCVLLITGFFYLGLYFESRVLLFIAPVAYAAFCVNGIVWVIERTFAELDEVKAKHPDDE